MYCNLVLEFSTRQLIILFKDTHSVKGPKTPKILGRILSWRQAALFCTKLDAGKDGSNHKN